MQGETSPSKRKAADMSPEAESRRRKLAETYMTAIAQNPFRFDDDDEIYKARVEEKKCRGQVHLAREYVPLDKRADDSEARAAMLRLQERSLPQVLPVIGSSKDVKELAETMGDAELQRYAPEYAGKYQGLDPEDAIFLAKSSRESGPKERTEDFIQRQKSVFLAELSSLTKRQEIDLLNGELKGREMELARAQAMLDAETQRFDQLVRQSDKGMAQAVETLEQAKHAKAQRQQKVALLKNQIMVATGQVHTVQDKLDKMVEYQQLIEDIIQLKTPQIIALRDRQLKRSEVIQQALDEYQTADGLCLDCFFLKSKAVQLCGKADQSCKHAHTVNYAVLQEIHLEPEREFFAQISNKPKLDFMMDPDRLLYGQILSSLFVPHVSSIEGQNPQVFIDCLRIFEANNFQLVEAIQGVENQIEANLKARREKAERNATMVTLLQNNLQQLQTIVGEKQQEEKEQKQEVFVQQIQKKTVDNITTLQKHVTTGYAMVTGAEHQEAVSVSLLSKLSVMEQLLEQAAVACTAYNKPDKQLSFEQACARLRARKAAQLKKDQAEELRKEKIERVFLKNKEPIQFIDQRRAVQVTRPKRKLMQTDAAIREEMEQTAESYYDQVGQ